MANPQPHDVARLKSPRLVFVASILGAFFTSLPSPGGDALGDSLGTIHFEVSGNPEAREHVVRGVKLVHHMMYPEADREFAAAASADPTCALRTTNFPGSPGRVPTTARRRARPVLSSDPRTGG